MSNMRLLPFLEERLEALLTVPDAWGTPEAVELQVLLLLEIRLVAGGAARGEVEGLQQRYETYLSREVPGPPATLAFRLALDSLASPRFVEVLRTFASLERPRRRGQRLSVTSYRAPIADRSGPQHYAAES